MNKKNVTFSNKADRVTPYEVSLQCEMIRTICLQCEKMVSCICDKIISETVHEICAELIFTRFAPTRARRRAGT